MTSRKGRARPARTLLEQMIWERNETLEEFVEHVEVFRREHKERGTLSLRHLERLIAGHRGDRSPLGPVRPATARLLEHVLGASIADLLTPPGMAGDRDSGTELRQRLSSAHQVDPATITLLRDQLNALRELDRKFGAVVAYDEVTTKGTQIAALQAHSLRPAIRASLAALLAETSALAGWEALDRNAISQAWDHHERAKLAAREAGSQALLAHALAQQAVVLTDIGECDAAVDQLAEARNLARQSAPALLRSWLAAAHGEGLAAAGRRAEALRAFDSASDLLPSDPIDPELPFVFLGGAHLDRWRGHALARLGHPDAVPVLADALRRLDSTFARAAIGVRIDLVTAFAASGDTDGAYIHIQRATSIADGIGSVRQANRIRDLVLSLKHR